MYGKFLGWLLIYGTKFLQPKGEHVWTPDQTRGIYDAWQATASRIWKQIPTHPPYIRESFWRGQFGNKFCLSLSPSHYPVSSIIISLSLHLLLSLSSMAQHTQFSPLSYPQSMVLPPIHPSIVIFGSTRRSSWVLASWIFVPASLSSPPLISLRPRYLPYPSPILPSCSLLR